MVVRYLGNALIAPQPHRDRWTNPSTSKTPRGGSRTICIMDTNEHASDWRNQHLGKWHSSEFQSLFEPTHTAKRLSWPLV